MPLQVGITAARSFAKGFVVTLGGLAWLALVTMSLVDRYREDGPSAFYSTLTLSSVVAFVALGFATHAAWLGLRARASDVVIDERGVRIEGGPHDGTLSTPTALATALSLETTTEGKKQVAHLCLHDAAGGRAVLARSSAAEETSSIASLLSTLRALADATAPPVLLSPVVLRCPGCTVPVAPIDSPHLACRHCGTTIPLSDGLREQLRAAEALARGRPQIDRAVRKLLRQPGARAVNRLSAGLAAIVVLSPVTALAAGVYQYSTADSVRLVTLNGLVELPFAVTLGAYLLLRARIVDRVALGLLTLDLAARRDAHGELVCRTCGGPLPTPPVDAAVAHCAYCGADNVLGVDLRGAASAVTRDQTNLTAMLSRRRRQRAWWALGGAASLAVLAHAGSLLAQGFEHNRSAKPTAHVSRGASIGRFDRPSHSASLAPRSGRIVVVEEGSAKDDPSRALRVLEPRSAVWNEGTLLVADASVRDPAWLGDDQVLYVTRAADGRAVLRLRRLGATEATDLHVAEDLERPSASLDGDRIAFAEREAGSWYVTLLAGGQKRRVIEGRAPHLHPFAERVVFVREVDGLTKLFVVDLRGKTAAARPLLRPNEHRFLDPAWSPCGAWVAFATNAGWEGYRTGDETRTSNVSAIPMDREGEIIPLTTGNAASRRPSWGRGAILHETDGHPDGTLRVYPLRPRGHLVAENHDRACVKRLGW